ncbi:MAG: regulatory protein TetR, partial [Conexibacter sp.]|nr:regulatory protein TetR [Conexibacter sp.]
MSAPTDKPRGRRNDPAIREADILDAAAVLFADLGYRATNLEHVARRLGVTRQALYYYFPKKHDILLALFDRVMSRFEHN